MMKKGAIKKVTRWYVEPINADTNENAMMDLVQSHGATDDKIHYGKMDNKGKDHDVVEVDRPFVTRMEHNASKFKHLFRIFTQTDGEGAMKLWPFGNKKKLSRTKEVRRVADEIAKILKRSK